MSLATTVLHFIVGERKNVEALNQVLVELGRCDDGLFPFEICGVSLNEKQTDEFKKEIKGLVQKQWDSDNDDIEELFWLAYAAAMLNIQLAAAKNHEKKFGLFLYKQFEKSGWEDIGNFISTIKLIK